MIDIFELLKHEGHELEIIKHGDERLLGCKKCGKTLLTEDFVKNNTQEYATILNTLEQCTEKAELYIYVKQLGYNILSLDDKDKERIIVYIKEDLNKRTSSVKVEFYIKEFISKIYTEIKGIKNAQKLIDACYSETAWDMQARIIKTAILKKAKEIIKGYQFFDNDEEISKGCKTYRVVNNCYAPYKFFAINEELAEKAEQELPTPTDVYKFKDVTDYYERRPEWEDEEEENGLYLEYIYRIENNLYDFSNLEMGEEIIIRDAIDYYAEYECVERYISPLKKVLKERYNIEL